MPGKHIRVVCAPNLQDSWETGGCGKCEVSCQSACKTSCTVSNQACQK